MRTSRWWFGSWTRLDGLLSVAAGALLLVVLATWSRTATIQVPAVEAVVAGGGGALVGCGLVALITAPAARRPAALAAPAVNAQPGTGCASRRSVRRRTLHATPVCRPIRHKP